MCCPEYIPRASSAESHQHWIEELGYSIEEWSPNEERLIEVLGRVHLMEMAASAFFAATNTRPRSVIRLCRGAQILRERRPN
jgi:hypothetical protein